MRLALKTPWVLQSVSPYWAVFFIFCVGLSVSFIFNQSVAFLLGGFLITGLVSIYLFLVIRRLHHLEVMAATRARDMADLNTQLASEIALRCRLERLKDEFIGTVSHEIRTPLTLIKSSICNLKDGVEGPMNPRQIQLAEQTNRHVNRLTRIINDLLDLSRLESGKAKINRINLDTRALMQEVVQSFQQSLKKHHLVLEMAFSHDIPQVFGDEDMLIQIFNNLISNAIRYAKSKVVLMAREIESEASSEDHSKFVQFTVADDGPGIPKEAMGALFEKFHQVNRSSGPGYKGTGLGLAICKEIVGLHYGKIWVEVPSEGGSHFHFTIAQYDPTTSFKNFLQEALFEAAQRHSSLAVVAFSFDKIDEIREDGGEAGVARLFDAIEKEIQREALRRTDHISRHFSTDHLIILFDKANEKAIQSIKSRLVEVVRSNPMVQALSANYAPVIGVAVYPDDGDEVDGLIQKAMGQNDAHS